jgi:hypothetical protein
VVEDRDSVSSVLGRMLLRRYVYIDLREMSVQL